MTEKNIHEIKQTANTCNCKTILSQKRGIDRMKSTGRIHRALTKNAMNSDSSLEGSENVQD